MVTNGGVLNSSMLSYSNLTFHLNVYLFVSKLVFFISGMCVCVCARARERERRRER